MAWDGELPRLSCQHLEELARFFSRRYSCPPQSALRQPRPLAVLSEAWCSSAQATENPPLLRVPSTHCASHLRRTCRARTVSLDQLSLLLSVEDALSDL